MSSLTTAEHERLMRMFSKMPDAPTKPDLQKPIPQTDQDLSSAQPKELKVLTNKELEDLIKKWHEEDEAKEKNLMPKNESLPPRETLATERDEERGVETTRIKDGDKIFVVETDLNTGDFIDVREETSVVAKR